jgi:hypothetical protein
MDDRVTLFQFSTGNKKFSLSKIVPTGSEAQSVSQTMSKVGFLQGDETAGG